MPNIKEVTFYFANPKQDANGNPIVDQPPESHTLTWNQVVNNVGFSLSTGESMFTELPDPANTHVIRVINGFYFGTGVCGSLLAIQYHYDDNSDGWISTIQYQSQDAKNTNVMIGNWIKGLTYDQITHHANWTGKPYIGLENDYIEVVIERIAPPPDPEPDPDPTPEPGCNLSLTPSIITIRLGETAAFDAMHPYTETGTWTFDPILTVIEQSNKRLVVQPQVLGAYVIRYAVNNCDATSTLYVIEPTPDVGDWTDPIEPSPPPLPDTPPDTAGTPSLAIELVDASKPIPPLYKYPNIMKRNARYRGHRESEKFLNDHQEQIYDIRQLYKDLTSLENMKKAAIDSWFYGLETVSISIKAQENIKESKEGQDNLADKSIDSIRAFENDVIQLNGNNFEERMVGIYEIKQRMKELDERIAEAERRYREYENAYE
jgi:hypothetical protein